MGAVAVLDALGFKGIWGDEANPDLRALSTLALVSKTVRRYARNLKGTLRNLPAAYSLVPTNTLARCFSDSILIAAWVSGRADWGAVARADPTLDSDTDADDEVAAQLVMRDLLRCVVCRAVARVISTSALAERPLVFRGAVSVGAFRASKSFFIGPAIDEAAELHEKPRGAFVMLAPSAAAIPQKYEMMGIPSIRRYAVPVAGGAPVQTMIVDPFSECPFEKRNGVAKAILAYMEAPDAEVQTKRDNTKRMLESFLSESLA